MELTFLLLFLLASQCKKFLHYCKQKCRLLILAYPYNACKHPSTVTDSTRTGPYQKSAAIGKRDGHGPRITGPVDPCIALTLGGRSGYCMSPPFRARL
jgi:hypothetical protein